MASAGYRSIAARWVGGASAFVGPPKPGYRSILAFWCGGASSYPYVPPQPKPEEPHGGGKGRRYEGEYVEINRDDEDMAILIPMFITVMDC